MSCLSEIECYEYSSHKHPPGSLDLVSSFNTLMHSKNDLNGIVSLKHAGFSQLDWICRDLGSHDGDVEMSFFAGAVYPLLINTLFVLDPLACVGCTEGNAV